MRSEGVWTNTALTDFNFSTQFSGTSSRKKRKPLLLERLPPYIYFQSLKMSANAKSSAVFMLFSIKDRISASNTDFFFFLLRSFT